MVTTIEQFKQFNESNDDTFNKIANKIIKSVSNIINDKMGGKIDKSIDLRDMVLDFMGSHGYIEDKKMVSFIVKELKTKFKNKLNENNLLDNDEQLYHEIDWNDMEQQFNTFSSVYEKENYRVMRQTFNFIKSEIEKYKMLN